MINTPEADSNGKDNGASAHSEANSSDVGTNNDNIFNSTGKPTISAAALKALGKVPAPPPIVATRNGQPAPTIPPELFDLLPEPLRRVLDTYEYQFEKELYFFSVLTMLGSLMQEVSCIYAGNRSYPSLFLCVYGPSGSGKSIMSMAANLADLVHQEKRNETKEALDKYKADKTKWDTDRRRAEKQDRVFDDPLPIRPREDRLFISDTITVAKIYKNLYCQKKPTGLYVASEIDILLSNLRSEHGNFSPMFRKAFDHETLRKENVGGGDNGEEREYEIENPRISVMLSGTQNQFIKLFGGENAVNGLLTRFGVYRTIPNTDFKDVLNHSNNFYENIQNAKQFVYDFAKWIGEAETRIRFTEHAAPFQDYWQTVKIKGMETLGDDYGGLVNRQALQSVRYAMVFHVLLCYCEGRRLESEMEIHPKAMSAAETLAAVSRWYLEDAFKMLVLGESCVESLNLTTKEKPLYALLPDNFTTAEALKIGKTLNISPATVHRLLKKPGVFEQDKHGTYRKN